MGTRTGIKGTACTHGPQAQLPPSSWWQGLSRDSLGCMQPGPTCASTPGSAPAQPAHGSRGPTGPRAPHCPILRGGDPAWPFASSLARPLPSRRDHACPARFLQDTRAGPPRTCDPACVPLIPSLCSRRSLFPEPPPHPQAGNHSLAGCKLLFKATLLTCCLYSCKACSMSIRRCSGLLCPSWRAQAALGVALMGPRGSTNTR